MRYFVAFTRRSSVLRAIVSVLGNQHRIDRYSGQVSEASMALASEFAERLANGAEDGEAAAGPQPLPVADDEVALQQGGIEVDYSADVEE